MTENNTTNASKTEYEASYDIREVLNNIKNESRVRPLTRCSTEGIKEFIDKEASSYSCKNIGNIQNSVAKNSVDSFLRKEKSEIVYGTDNSIQEVNEACVYPFDISLTKIKELLTTHVTKWVFQTTNSNLLKTFYAKSNNDSCYIEIFINMERSEQISYINFGNKYIGYISTDVALSLRESLMKVYDNITEDLSNSEIVWVNENVKLEKINLEDPDLWLIKKNSAISEFLYDEKIEESFLEKLFKYFNLINFENTCFNNCVLNESLNDSFVSEYFLEKVTIDIKQVYA